MDSPGDGALTPGQGVQTLFCGLGRTTQALRERASVIGFVPTWRNPVGACGRGKSGVGWGGGSGHGDHMGLTSTPGGWP